MRLNIFAGARRTSLVLGVIWVAGALGYATLNKPYTTSTYVIATLGAQPVLASSCGEKDARSYPDPTMPWGERLDVNVVLCFSAHRADNGADLIPYAPAEGGKVWMSDKYSAEVTRYAKGVADSFVFSDDVQRAAAKIQRDALVEQWRHALAVMVSGVAFGWLLVAVIGWIVRGFLGIPRGQDGAPHASS